ncbi:hypothetical protein DUI87_10873 [Hirundo rustica rustica]|uniref:Uncharacterized protein n=1 Tax=Hirundo rustica rustica TaxID=333673 RepID=A0A3M0KJA5_HIRRU|nr:hypothetical protein DUI87_10873 [Hirundo rustica rustica]
MPLAFLATWAHPGSCPASVDQHSQLLFHQAALQALCPQPVVLLGIVVTQIQEPEGLHPIESHTIGSSPWIQPVQIPLQSLPALQQIYTPTQVSVICKLTAGALNPIIQIIDKDIKQDNTDTEPLGKPLVTNHQLDVAPFTTTLWARPSR